MATELDDLIRKVQGLLAKAESTNFPEEAESCRQLAERLMWKHRIDAATFRESGASPADPVWREFPVCSAFSEYVSTYWSVCSAIISHFDCRGVARMGGAERLSEIVGWEAETRMVETTYTEFRLAFQAKLEPKVDRSLSDQINAYNLRSAGLEGRRIAQMLYGENTKALRSKVRNMFKREAELRGEDPKALLGEGPVKGFRRSFAQGFEMEVWSRLASMRRARGDASVGLVLASSKERVDEAFYQKYPAHRPVKPSGELGLDGAVNSHANCAKCKRAKSGYCRDHAWLRPGRTRVERLNHQAYDRGRVAARSVDLGAAGGRRIER